MRSDFTVEKDGRRTDFHDATRGVSIDETPSPPHNPEMARSGDEANTYSDSFETVKAAKPVSSRKTPSRATTVQETEETVRLVEEDQASADPLKTRESVDKLRALLRRVQELEMERDQLRGQLWRTKGGTSRLLAVVMLVVGAISLVSAVVYTVTVLAFVGMGVTFCGVLLLQLRPSSYLKAELLDSTVLSPIMMTEELLSELGYVGKGVYMRDKEEETVVFVPAANVAEIPFSSQLGKNIFLESPKGVILTPPGRSLAHFLERELGGKTTIRELASLQGRLARTLIQNLEIAKDFEMHLEAGHVRLRFVGSIYASLSKELQDTTRICSTLGSPICSAMACILTGSTQRPVAFEGESLSENGSVMEASYRILQEA